MKGQSEDSKNFISFAKYMLTNSFVLDLFGFLLEFIKFILEDCFD